MSNEHQLRILVVEDEALVALMIEDMLVDLGCVVAGTAGSVEQALVLVGETNFDGAIVDLNLAGTKAYPVAEALAARSLPFVFLTGYGAAGIDPRFADRLTVSKPFHQEALAAVIAHFRAEAHSPE